MLVSTLGALGFFNRKKNRFSCLGSALGCIDFCKLGFTAQQNWVNVNRFDWL